MELKTLGLCKSFKGKKVVNEVSLQIESGKVIGLLGPNGAGKTTSFYMIVGLIQPDAGRVELQGEDLSGRPISERARMGLCYLPQEPSVFRKLSVQENLMVVLDNLRIGRSERRTRVERALKDLGIDHLATHLAYTLSGGERRRLEISRAMILEPKFLLLDEPYAGIDPLAVQDIQNIILRLKERNIGIMITDHNVRETLSTCDEAYLIRDGKIWIHGTPNQIVSNESAKRFYLGEGFRL